MQVLWKLAIVLGSLSFASCGHAQNPVGGAPESLRAVQPALAPSDPGNSSASAAMAVANQVREQNGLPAMTVDPVLTAVAQAQAEDMLRRHYFDHNTPEGLTPFDRLNRAGVSFSAAAENIAMGVEKPAEVFQMWLGSPAHRANLLNRIYGRQGIGFAGGYWVQDFAD